MDLRGFIPRRFWSLTVLVALVVAALALVPAKPASAVTYGELDGDDHPYVGLLVFDVNGSPAWRCTGTLLTPRIVLTAGHCTYGADGARIWFESDVESGIPANGYPTGGGTSIEAKEIYTHPDYDDSAFYLHDVGIVVLSKPAKKSLGVGQVSELGVLDDLDTKPQQLFTPVGYGLQGVKPIYQADRVRYKASVMLINIKGTAGIPEGTSVIFSNNPGKPHEGGTCFGDSGGPVFLEGTNTIVAVTSFGLNPNCAGTGGGYRADTLDAQAFIKTFLK